jgi:hypothetical protein
VGSQYWLQAAFQAAGPAEKSVRGQNCPPRKAAEPQPKAKAFPIPRDVCYSTTNPKEGNAMKDFIRKYRDQLNGTLSGFDRLVFRGWVEDFARAQRLQAGVRYRTG